MKSLNTYKCTDKQIIEHLIIPVIFEGLLRQQLDGKERTLPDAKKIYEGFRNEIEFSLAEMDKKRRAIIERRLMRLCDNVCDYLRLHKYKLSKGIFLMMEFTLSLYHERLIIIPDNTPYYESFKMLDELFMEEFNKLSHSEKVAESAIKQIPRLFLLFQKNGYFN
jgi:hypothetical protein